MKFTEIMRPSIAREAGFKIDTHPYPWFAYKGPRFKPTEGHDCMTDIEESLVSSIENAHQSIGPFNSSTEAYWKRQLTKLDN